MIEILSPTDIIEHMNFKHPRMTREKYGRMYFSTDKEYMLEKCINHEIFIFKRELTDDYQKTKEVKWRKIKRIINHSIDLSEFSYFNYLYSPNLMLFVDADSSGDCFTIKSTIDQSIVLQIPVGVLSPKIDNPKDIVRKFKWVSDSKFMIINSDSLEKLFEITPEKTLKILGYGRVPMIDWWYRNEDKVLYYHDPMEE